MTTATKLISIRVWTITQAKLDDIARVTGVEKNIRLVDALANGWFILTHEQRRQATIQSASECPDGTSRQVRSQTWSKLEALANESGMTFTRLVEAMAEGWNLLTPDQQREAILQSAT